MVIGLFVIGWIDGLSLLDEFISTGILLITSFLVGDNLRRRRRACGRPRRTGRTGRTRTGPARRTSGGRRAHPHRPRSARRGCALGECHGDPGSGGPTQPGQFARRRRGSARGNRVDRPSDDDRTACHPRRTSGRLDGPTARSAAVTCRAGRTRRGGRVARRRHRRGRCAQPSRKRVRDRIIGSCRKR